MQVRNAHAEAVVSLYGAQVLSYRPVGAGADVLFLSERANYEIGKAIRGGVPVCWPWFGPDPQGLGRPNHGFARTRLWSVLSTGATPVGETQVTLGLRDAPDTRALWPHAFELTLQITVGPRCGWRSPRATRAMYRFRSRKRCTATLPWATSLAPQ